MTDPAIKENNTPPAGTPPKEEPVNIPVERASENKYVEEKDLLNWQAPARPFKRRNREYWVTIFSIAALLAFILFLAEGIMPVVLIVSLSFLYYVLSTVQPESVTYKITNRGIKIVDRYTYWDAITRFWFAKKLDGDLLVFETLNFPGRMELVVLSKDLEQIRNILLKYIPEEKPAQTPVDKATDWISKKLPNN